MNLMTILMKLKKRSRK